MSATVTAVVLVMLTLGTAAAAGAVWLFTARHRPGADNEQLGWVVAGLFACALVLLVLGAGITAHAAALTTTDPTTTILGSR